MESEEKEHDPSDSGVEKKTGESLAMQMPLVEVLNPCRTRSKSGRGDGVARWMKGSERRCAVPLYGTANFPRTSTAHLRVVICVESNEYSARSLISNGEGPTAVLRVSFGVADV